MYLRKNIKVPEWNRNCCLYAVIFLTSTLSIGQASSSDSNNKNLNSEAYASRKIASSGSGSGSLETRSSYAVISQAMSETINNEFGSEYERAIIEFARISFRRRSRRDHLTAEGHFRVFFRLLGTCSITGGE